MKNILILCIFCTMLFSCTPQQRFNRFASRHPELFQKDTIHAQDTGTVKLKEPTPEKLSEVDSLLYLLLNCGNDSLVTSQSHDSNKNISNLQNKYITQSHKQHIKNKILDLYKNKPCIAPGDTLRYTSTYTEKGITVKITVKVWQEGDKLKFANDKTVITDKANITVEKKEKWVWPVIICMALFIGLLLFFRR